MRKLLKSLTERIDLIVLLTCLLIVYFSWSYGIANDRTDLTALENKNHEVVSLLSEEVESIFSFIDGLRGLYASSSEVTNEDLMLYLLATDLNELHNEVLRISYVAKIPNDKVPEYEKLIRSASNPEYEAQIVDGYDEQYFVYQVVDKNGKYYPSSGLNLLTEPTRKSMLDKIIAGAPTGVVQVPFINNVEEYDGQGFIFTVPVYKNGELAGFVNALVSKESLVNQIEEALGDSWGWRWYQDDEYLASREIENEYFVESSSVIPVTSNVNWKLSLETEKSISTLWNIVLGGGVLFSFLMYVVVYALSTANTRGTLIAKSMTQVLMKYKLALDSASNHIVITDENGVVIYANKAAQILTGFELKEILGNTPRLWGGQMGKDFYTNFWKAIKVDKRVFSGVFTNKRKNGELYSAQATVSPIINENGELVGFVGVEEDVTEEKKNAKDKEESLAKLAAFNELMIGRELKMVELKKEIKSLKADYEK